MLTRGQNAVDELLVSDPAILISINATKNIQYPGFEVTYPLHVSFPPDVEVKISKLLQLRMPKRQFLDNHMDSKTNVFFYQSYSAVLITSFSLCRCSSSLLCLPWARSQSFLHWLTSWHITGVWGSSFSSGRGTDGGGFAVPLLSEWIQSTEITAEDMHTILTAADHTDSLLTCWCPATGRNLLLGNQLVFTGFCGIFDFWYLPFHLIHEILQSRNSSISWT